MKKAIKILVVLLLLSKVPILNAYDPATHRAIGEHAAHPTVSQLDNILKSELGIPSGVDQRFFGPSLQELRSVAELIGDGSFFEDASLRFFNHFHNPLYQADGTGRGPWNQAGLRTFSILGVPLIRGQSSVLWQQNPSQDTTFVFTPLPFLSGGGNWSWQDARRHYLNALTRSRKEDQGNQLGRDTAFAETFEALGRLTHLIQDASVPAHVRNDPHLISDGFEDWASGNPSRVQNLIAGELKKPDRSIFSLGVPIPDLSARVPIARLLDTDQYNLPNPNPNITPGATIGLTEYTNANFFSDDTVFKDFPFPAQTSVELGTEEIEPNTNELRRYFLKARDGETGYRLAVPSQLHKFLPDALKDKKIGLDDKVYDDYASKLLPRAVGYSAGLLDYFFRGKLDVDLVPDPNSTDPTVVKLSGTNGSTDDALVDGTLALYADGPDGTRSPVPSLEPLNVSNIAPGQKISRRFQVDQEAERFIAVYKGTLGNEVKDPTNNFPGGVIGKVLGGLRAESIFPQGDKRMLRTVPVNGVGIFPLPAEADRLENIQWGDQDNTFVGILSNPDTPRSPDQILAFRINRPLGSGEAPLIDGLDGTQVVSADILKAVNFPFDLSLGVTVNYSQTFRVQQARLAFDVVDTNVFVQTDPKDPTVGFYELASREVTAPIVQTVLDQTIPFFQSFPIVLDRAHHCSQSCFSFGDFPFFIGPIIRPYVWKVREVTLDQQGRLLALVDVILVEPDNRTRTGDLAEEDIFGRGRWTVVAGFQVPVPGLLRGVIDVDNGKVVGVTSSPAVSLASQHTISFTSLKQHRVTTHIGGPLGGTTKETEILGRFSSENPNFATVETGTARTPTAGLLSEAILGRFRSDLEPLITVPTGIGTREFEFPLVYFVDDVTQTNKSIRVAFTSSFSTGTIIPLAQPQMIRLTTGVSPQVLLLFSQQVLGIFVFQAEGIPVRWSPEFPANTALALSHRLPPVDSYSLLYTTSQAALLHFAASEVPDPQLGPGVFTLLVDFASQQTQTFPGLLGFQYVLLDPKFLYNLNDTKFHTLDPSLRPTALPRRLADAVPFRPPTAAYHLIKLR